MIDADTYARARKLDPRAAEQILGAVYPAVHRLAHALTGRADAARKVTAAIMRRGLERMPRWAREGDAERWFLHHTVLVTRRLVARDAEPGDDVLVQAAGTDASPQYVAFVRALRKLAHQPREAVVLHHAEQLDARQLATAMDCSLEAASNHLATGRRELLPAAGDALNQLLAKLAAAYQSLTPQESLALPMVRSSVRRYVWPRRVWRWTRNALTIGLVLAMAYLAYRYVPLLDY